jgi:hypothetical protein
MSITVRELLDKTTELINRGVLRDTASIRLWTGSDWISITHIDLEYTHFDNLELEGKYA